MGERTLHLSQIAALCRVVVVFFARQLPVAIVVFAVFLDDVVGSVNNNLHLFFSGGVDYLNIALGWCEPFAQSGVVGLVDAVIQGIADRFYLNAVRVLAVVVLVLFFQRQVLFTITVVVNALLRHTAVSIERALFLVKVFNVVACLTAHELRGPLGTTGVGGVGVEVFIRAVVDHAEAAILVVCYLARLRCVVVDGFAPACEQGLLHHLVGLFGALCLGYLCQRHHAHTLGGQSVGGLCVGALCLSPAVSLLEKLLRLHSRNGLGQCLVGLRCGTNT